MSECFDYIVVGSGSSGGVVAARLSERSDLKVACIEAGSHGSRYIWSRSPLGGAFMIHNPHVNWNDYSEPNSSHGGRPIHVPHGKILGGSSAINATIVNRGQRHDYDHWAQLGCLGWSYADLLPYFKQLERTTIGSDEQRGRDGPVEITNSAKLTGFYDLFIASAMQTGLPYNDDYCDGRQEGVAMAQLAAARGVRNSTATAYLARAASRNKLKIIRGAQASRLIFEGNKCVGVQINRGGVIQELKARREVIVSCGAINSPQLLELSGIGNPEVLRRNGVETRVPLAGVGQNLRDHYGPTLKWELRDPRLSLSRRGRGWRLGPELLRYLATGKGLMAQGIGTMRVFAKSHPGVEDTDIQMIANPFLVDVKDGKRSMSPVPGFFVSTQNQRPESAGSVHIRSGQAIIPPAIEYSFLNTEADRQVAIAGFRLARRIAEAAPLADVILRELAPGLTVQSDDEILDYISETGATTYHPVGTCKMGVDEAAVVDHRLRVHGAEGLRIADASIMPTIVSGNTSIPCMMIGEKAAAMILQDSAG